MTDQTSRTPRTDALWNREEWRLRFKVWREHARQLERELAEAKDEAERESEMAFKAKAVLKFANSQTEHFERLWYLCRDELEKAEARCRELERDAQPQQVNAEIQPSAPSDVMGPVKHDAPVMKAWNNYKAGDDFRNTRRWALHEAHVDGSLWAAFYAGYFACAVDSTDPSAPQSEQTHVLVPVDAMACHCFNERDKELCLDKNRCSVTRAATGKEFE